MRRRGLLVVALAVAALAAAPAPFVVLNIVAGVVYALALPFVAIVTSYDYFDARARHELEPEDLRGELPAEHGLAP